MRFSCAIHETTEVGIPRRAGTSRGPRWLARTRLARGRVVSMHVALAHPHKGSRALAAFVALAFGGCISQDHPNGQSTQAVATPPPSSLLGETAAYLLASGPEGYWRLNDVNSTMTDYSSHHFNGQYHDTY